LPALEDGWPGGETVNENSATPKVPAAPGRGVPPALGCLASLALGLACVGVFYLVLALGLQGEVRVPRGELGEVRLWLIREPGYQGLGNSSTRVVLGSERSGQACLRTSIRFLLLEAEEPVENVVTCECFVKEGENWSSVGECAASGP
jgi:hypothetical protein